MAHFHCCFCKGIFTDSDRWLGKRFRFRLLDETIVEGVVNGFNGEPPITISCNSDNPCSYTHQHEVARLTIGILDFKTTDILDLEELGEPVIIL